MALVSATITRRRPDGTEATAEVLVDTETGSVTQMGADVEITAEEIDLIKIAAATPYDESESPT